MLQYYGRFFARIPKNWRSLLGLFAYLFHFQPSEMWEFDEYDFELWKEQAEIVIEAKKKAYKR